MSKLFDLQKNNNFTSLAIWNLNTVPSRSPRRERENLAYSQNNFFQLLTSI